MAADGITVAIATPHQLGRYDGCNSSGEVREAVAALNEVITAEGIPLRLVPGGDVRLDERIPELLARDQITTLADRRRHLLLELPFQTQINPIGLVRQLASMGITAILTHPERCKYLCENPRILLAWVEQGMAVQLTAASVVGAFGPAAERASWYWLQQGVVSLIATDAHNHTIRRPCMSAVFIAIGRRLGRETAYRICIKNPRYVFEGKEIPSHRTLHTEMRAWRPTVQIH